MKGKSRVRCMLLALAFMSSIFLISAGQVFAGVGGSDTPTFSPTTVILGQIGFPGSFIIVNASTAGNASHNVKATNFLLTTACGTTGSIPCPVGQQEDGVPPTPIEIFPLTATGEAGTACAGKTFTVAKTANPSEYQFTPLGGDVILGPSNVGGALATCQVNFTVDIKELPVHDSNANAGLQTSQLASVTLQDVTTLEFGSGTGSSTLTVVEACINIDKTCDGLSKIGDDVNYSITVTNCSPAGIPPLECTIDDDLLKLLPSPKFPKNVTLASGAQDVTNETRKVQPGDPDPLVNTAKVTCTLQNTSVVVGPKEDKCSVNLFQPCVNMQKTCNPKEVEVNTPVNYTVTVTNCSSSDTPPLNCTIDDNLLKLLPSPKFPKNVTLASGSPPDVTNETRPVQSGDNLPLTNTATVNCTVQVFGNPVGDNDSCTVRKKPGDGGGGGAEEPYKAVVNDDLKFGTDYPFYISPKLKQFLHPNTDYNCEVFGHSSLIPKPEVCCTKATVDNAECPCVDPKSPTDCSGAPNYKVGANNCGWYRWAIQLPKKPGGELNIQIECGILKPNSFEIYKDSQLFEPIEICAAETGEQVQPNCTRKTNSLLSRAALPTIGAMAFPGCQHSFTPFHLTAYRNPSEYKVTAANTASMQLLNGEIDTIPSTPCIDPPDTKTRIALKPCMEKSIMVKFPLDGWINQAGEREVALQAGDIIVVEMAVPKQNTVDVYCNKYSVKIGGIGEPEVLNDDFCSSGCP